MKFKKFIEGCVFTKRPHSESIKICSELLDSGIDFPEVLSEEVITVHNDSVKIIQEIEGLESPTVEKITKLLNSYDVEFKNNPEILNPLEAYTNFNGMDYRIVIEFKNISNEVIQKSKLHLHDLANKIGLLYAHEMVHVHQYNRIQLGLEKKNDFLKRTSSSILSSYENKRKEYLSHPREIMAFAASIYQELLSTKLSANDIHQLLKESETFLRYLKANSPVGREYLMLFRKDEKTRKKLFKYIYEYSLKNLKFWEFK